MTELNVKHLKIWFKSFIMACLLGAVLLIIYILFSRFNSMKWFVFLSLAMERFIQIYIFIIPLIPLGKSVKFIVKDVLLNEKVTDSKLGYVLFAITETIIIIWVGYMLLIYILELFV